MVVCYEHLLHPDHQIPYLLEAIRTVEIDVAPAAIDDAMRLGCGHPVGPLVLADLICLDTVASISATLYPRIRKG
ncbi:3-hydroxyacyl-CoA dehydrogenase family protein [Rhodococcus sp. NPDC057529]|uniref:3-hydroxyacyl-CoA dehydrogenase family protein n=1 Tax=Rhodococcus sp. NPDC057529 TaxID=3346158 RepID=UPI00366B2829